MIGSTMIATFASIVFKLNFSLEYSHSFATRENGYRESSVGVIACKSFGNSFKSEASYTISNILSI